MKSNRSFQAVTNYISLFLLSLIFPYSSAQGQSNLAKAVAFNGIDERCYKSNPVGMELNGAERITASTERDFEISTGNWSGAGNHSIIQSSVYKKAGTYSGKITATGAGDGSTNYVQLTSSAFTVLVAGEKYVYELWTYGDTVGITLGLTVGDKTITGKTIYNATPGTFKKTVFRFQATSSTINQPIRLYLSGAGSCYIDVVSLTQGFDELVIGWAKSNGAADQRIFGRQNPDLWSIYETGAGKLGLYLATSGGNDDVIFASSENINTGAWVLFAHTIDQAGEAKVFVNGLLGASGSVTNLGKFSPVPTLDVASFLTIGYSNLIIGQSQLVHFTSLPADIETKILDAFNNGIPDAWAGGTVVAHYRFRGNDDASFLKDETGNNNLTGVNVTQADDQVAASYPIFIEPPLVPTLASPVNNSSNVTLPPMLSWNTSVGATSYKLQVAADANFTSLIYNISGLTTNSQRLDSLYGGATYFWRVSATNEGGASDWSTVWSLVTEYPPPAPSLISPTNGVVSSSELLVLKWDSLANVSSYQLQVATNASFTTVLFDTSGLTNPTELFGAPSNSATYYWRVKATNGGGASNWSIVSSVQVSSLRPRILFMSADIPTMRAKYNSGGFPFSNFHTAILSNWNQSPNPNQEQVDYDRSRAQYAKIFAFRYMMEQNLADGDRAYDYLSYTTPPNQGDMYIMDPRYDRWMTNGLALIDYCIAYDLLDGMNYFQDKPSAKSYILKALYKRATALYSRAIQDRTALQFLSDVSTSNCYELRFLGLNITSFCLPAIDDKVVQEARFHQEIGNIRIIVAAALGVAAHAAIAPSWTIPDWLNYAKKDVEHFLLNIKRYPDIQYGGELGTLVMESQNVDGVFPEGIEYLNYAAEGFVPYIIADKNNQQSDYTQDLNLRKILDWSYDVQLPTGEAPQLNSSGFKVYPLSSLFGSLSPNGANYLWQLQKFSQNTSKTTTLPVEGICLLNNPPEPSPKQFAPLMANATQGQVIYRNISPTPTKYVLVSAKKGAARYAASTHGHAEAGSFIFVDGDKQLVRHPGYSGDSKSAEYEKATAHSTICPVDNNEIRPDETYREAGLPPSTDVNIISTKSTSDFNYIDESFELNGRRNLTTVGALWSLASTIGGGESFGYTYSRWLRSTPAKVNYGVCDRKFLMINNSYLVIRDEITRTSEALQYAVSLIQGNNGDNVTEPGYATGAGFTSNGDEVYWNSGSGPILRVNTSALSANKIPEYSGFRSASHQDSLTRDVAYHAAWRTAVPFVNNYAQIISILESDQSMENKASQVYKQSGAGNNYVLYNLDGVNKTYGRHDVIFSQKQATAINFTPSGLPSSIATDASFLVMSFTNNFTDVNSIKIFASNATYIRYGGYGFIPNETGDAQTSFTIIAIPPAPTLALPLNNATNISIPPALNWNASTGATAYNLQVSTDQTFQSNLIVDQHDITGISYNVSGLAYSTTYYWHVNAKNVGGTSNWSPTWAFTTDLQRVQVCLATNPSGLIVVVNGSSHTTPYCFSWPIGTSVSISTNSPQSGGSGIQYPFSNWSDGGAISHTVTPYSDMTYTANFTTQYYLWVSSPYGAPDGQRWYDAGTITHASVAPGTVTEGVGIQYAFTNWSGDATGINNNSSSDITMNAPKTAVANWKTQYKLTMSTGSCCTISPNAGDYWIDAGGLVWITATPCSGYVFSDWSGSGPGSYSGTNPSPSFLIMYGPITEIASCAQLPPPPHTISASAGAEGWIIPSGNVSVPHGSNQTFTMQPQVGYFVSNVMADNTNYGAQWEFTFTYVVADHTISVSFVPCSQAGPPQWVNASTIIGDYNIYIDWDFFSGSCAIGSFNIYRMSELSGYQWEWIGSVNGSTLSFADYGHPDYYMTFYYYVTTVDVLGRESAPSPVASILFDGKY